MDTTELLHSRYNRVDDFFFSTRFLLKESTIFVGENTWIRYSKDETPTCSSTMLAKLLCRKPSEEFTLLLERMKVDEREGKAKREE